MADLLEISAPSIETLENEDAGEGEVDDEEEEKRRQMKGIRRTVLRVSRCCGWNANMLFLAICMGLFSPIMFTLLLDLFFSGKSMIAVGRPWRKKAKAIQREF